MHREWQLMHMHVLQGDWLVWCDESPAVMYCMSFRNSKDETKAQVTGKLKKKKQIKKNEKFQKQKF